METNEPNQPASEILTREFVASKLSHIFDDSIVLDSKFTIISLSKSSANLFGCKQNELTGKPLNCLSGNFNLAEEVSRLLKEGYFNGQCFELKKPNGEVIRTMMSGINLGMISDFNEFFILTVKDLNPTYKLIRKLKTKEAILENLVYRASHDLRGPIATVLGLVNLAKMREDDKEIDKLFELIASHSKLLDQRLHSLVTKTAAKELKADSRF